MFTGQEFVALFEGLRNTIKLAVSGRRFEVGTSRNRRTTATYSSATIDCLPCSAGGTGMNEMFLSVLRNGIQPIFA
jgi:hypothetical protein